MIYSALGIRRLSVTTHPVVMIALAICIACAAFLNPAKAQTEPLVLDDNVASIAVVIGNRDYRQTVPVDYAHNDADAMQAYLVQTLGYRAENVFVLRDGTLSELTQMFGSDARPQSGRLWRSVTPDQSNVFVYFSGHGVPDLATGEPFLLPSDGDPNSVVSGYPLETLYRNLDVVKQRIGPDRQVIVMIDACFTGETGRGESLLAVSSPGFLPALPDSGDGVIRLVATSGTSPANWDDDAQLGLFTSRFLMGAAGLADDEGSVEWNALSTYLVEAVSSQALRDSGRTQIPEIDTAAFDLPQGEPVAPVAQAVAEARDEIAWAGAQSDRAALERYVADCQGCRYREEALAEIAALNQGAASEEDRALWQELSAVGDYRGYLDQCGRVCAYGDVARSYLGASDPTSDARVAGCDGLAGSPNDPDLPDGLDGVAFSRIDGYAAIAACEAAASSYPETRRLHTQLGRAYDRLGRYSEAMNSYRTAAGMGSLVALNNIATLIENGEGVPASPETAFLLYLEAAEGGNVFAMTNVGRMLEYGRGTGLDVREAYEWYERAAERGDSFALTKMMAQYIDPANGTPDYERALDMMNGAVERGEPLAVATIAVLLDNGFDTFFPHLNTQDLLLLALSNGETGVTAILATTNNDQQLQPASISALQQTISDLGFYTGQIDGTFNPLFTQALNAYARSSSSQIND